MTGNASKTEILLPAKFPSRIIKAAAARDPIPPPTKYACGSLLFTTQFSFTNVASS
jgi:hypothetical protein